MKTKGQKTWIIWGIIITISMSLNIFWLYQMTAGERLIVKKTELDQFRDIIERYQEVEQLSKYVEKHYYKEVDKDVLTEGMMKGLFEALNDPYSQFMDASTYARYEENISGKFPGIGIYFEPTPQGQILILSTIENTPAFNAGLKSQDVIVGIDGKEFDSDEFEVMVGALKGEVGTTVKLKVYRPSDEGSFEVSVMRDFIDIEATVTQMIDDKTAYLRLLSFDEASADNVEKHLKAFEKQGVENLVLDLRQNPGGYLSAAIEISDMFLDEGVIVSTKSRSEGDSTYRAKVGKYPFNLAVLIDRGSASASEILTGALKENKVAVIIGEQSFGKGLVQEFQEYTDDRGFKLTTAQYFTPDGNYIQGVGIEPDVFISQIKENENQEDDTVEKAVEILRNKN